jgi:hypothetical protein
LLVILPPHSAFAALHTSLRVWLLAPYPFSRAGSAFHPQPLLLVLDYSSLFMFFSIARRSAVYTGAVLDYFLGGGLVGELCMVCDANLSFCSCKQTALEPAGGEKEQLSIGSLSKG